MRNGEGGTLVFGHLTQAEAYGLLQGDGPAVNDGQKDDDTQTVLGEGDELFQEGAVLFSSLLGNVHEAVLANSKLFSGLKCNRFTATVSRMSGEVSVLWKSNSAWRIMLLT